MSMDPPPSRYRVVERGGRLVVLDSAAGAAPPTARDMLPGMTSDDRADPAPLLLTDAAPDDGGPSLSAARPPVAQKMIAEPPGLLRNVASTICNDRRDRDGRLQWTTARWFDAKGPRTIALSTTAEQQLGFAALALLAVTVGAIVVAVGFGWIGFVILLVAMSMLRQARPAATASIDRLAAR